MAPHGAPLEIQLPGFGRLAQGTDWTKAVRAYLEDADFIKTIRSWTVSDPPNLDWMLDKVHRVFKLFPSHPKILFASTTTFAGEVNDLLDKAKMGLPRKVNIRDRAGANSQTKAAKMLARLIKQRGSTHPGDFNDATDLTRQCQIATRLLFEIMAEHHSSTNSYLRRAILQDSSLSEPEEPRFESKPKSSERLQNGKIRRRDGNKSRKRRATEEDDQEIDSGQSRVEPRGDSSPSDKPGRINLHNKRSRNAALQSSSSIGAGDAVLPSSSRPVQTSSTPQKATRKRPLATSEEARGELLPSSTDPAQDSSKRQKVNRKEPLATSKGAPDDLQPFSTTPVQRSSKHQKVTREEPLAISKKTNIELLLDVNVPLQGSSCERQRVAREGSHATSERASGDFLPLSAGPVQGSSLKPQRGTREEQTTSSGGAGNHLLPLSTTSVRRRREVAFAEPLSTTRFFSAELPPAGGLRRW